MWGGRGEEVVYMQHIPTLPVIDLPSQHSVRIFHEDPGVDGKSLSVDQ